jgi:cation diffusion facilitator family transporter
MARAHGRDISGQVARVLWITLVLNAGVAFGKIAIGTATGALSITADGFHSLIDAAGNVVALVASRIAAQPPDADHPFGHRRVETIAALGIGVLLLFTAYEVVTSAFERLQSGDTPQISALSFIVLAVTLGINIFVAVYERREGKRLGSQILLADSENTRADVLVTLSVIAGLGLTLAGIAWADAVIALVIVVLIARAGWGILKRTGGVLIDRAPLPEADLTAVVAQVPAVDEVVRVRSRGPGNDAYVDIDVAVPPETTADRAAAIAGAIRQKITAEFDGVSEVEVHFEPKRETAPDFALLTRACADALGLATHAVHVTEGPDGAVLEMHVEVPAVYTLGQAHERVNALEADLRRAIPRLTQIISHIEPRETLPAPDAPALDLDDVQREAAAVLHSAFPEGGWHDIQVTGAGEGASLTAHAALPADTALTDAHILAEQAERALRARLPALQRVTIHTEPHE